MVDHYIGEKILLPRGDEIARDPVVGRKKDANGSIMGRAHTNPILDSRIYQVDFSGGKVTELTINAIAESMYTHCHADIYSLTYQLIIIRIIR